LRRLGEDVSEMLEYLPAGFYVIRHVRPKLSCRGCERGCRMLFSHSYIQGLT
jgi:transposase